MSIFRRWLSRRLQHHNDREENEWSRGQDCRQEVIGQYTLADSRRCSQKISLHGKKCKQLPGSGVNYSSKRKSRREDGTGMVSGD